MGRSTRPEWERSLFQKWVVDPIMTALIIGVLIGVVFMLNRYHNTQQAGENSTRTCVVYEELTVCANDHNKYRLTPSMPD